MAKRIKRAESAADEPFEEGQEAALVEAEADAADTAAPEPDSPRPRRRSSKTRAPSRQAAPLRQRVFNRGRSTRPASSSASGERRKPMQLSLLSAMSPGIVSGRTTRVGGGILIFLILIGGIILAYHVFAGSRFFTLKGIEVEGNSLLPPDEIEARVRAAVPTGVLNADLAAIKKSLDEHPLIRSAQVARLLPDRLRVTIEERQPVALAIKRDGVVVCVDDEGHIFGDQSAWRGKTIPPVIKGLAENGDQLGDINHQWIMTYRALIADLDQNEPPLSSRIDTVEFHEDRGVQVTLADTNVIVLLGKADYRTRLNAALDVVEAVRKRDGESLNVLRIADAERLLSGVRIAYLNVTDPNRIVVGLDE
ncbi:MAG: cell division protein FtsQ/DivIB [Blastocatellia bacterium]